jgi:hypothetical protein
MNISGLRRRLPSPALVISCVALFSALGGGAAYAASSVGSVAPTWHNVSLQNSWSPYSGGPTGYAKDSNGVVHLRGEISGSSSVGLKAFTLPVGDRPSHTLYLPIYTLSYTEGSLEITTGGSVIPYGNNAGGLSSLDGVSFVAGE